MNDHATNHLPDRMVSHPINLYDSVMISIFVAAASGWFRPLEHFLPRPAAGDYPHNPFSDPADTGSDC